MVLVVSSKTSAMIPDVLVFEFQRGKFLKKSVDGKMSGTKNLILDQVRFFDLLSFLLKMFLIEIFIRCRTFTFGGFQRTLSSEKNYIL